MRGYIFLNSKELEIRIRKYEFHTPGFFDDVRDEEIFAYLFSSDVDFKKLKAWNADYIIELAKLLVDKFQLSLASASYKVSSLIF
jgi:site-specific recombinase